MVASLLNHAIRDDMAYFEMADLEKLRGGKSLLKKDPAWNRRGLMGLVEQAEHWQSERERLIAESGQEHDGWNYHLLPGGKKLRVRLAVLKSMVALLSRRNVKLLGDDLVRFIDAAERSGRWDEAVSASAAIKQAEFTAKSGGLAESIRASLRRLHHRLGEVSMRVGKKEQARIDKMLQEKGGQELPLVGKPPPPAPLGSPRILPRLKAYLGLMDEQTAGGVEMAPFGDDAFFAPVDSPLAEAHATLSRVIQAGNEYRRYNDFDWIESTLPLDKLSPEERGRLYLAACERIADAMLPSDRDDEADHWGVFQTHSRIIIHLSQDAAESLTFPRADAIDALLFPSAQSGYYATVDPWMVQLAEEAAADTPLSPGERHVIHRLRCVAIADPPMGAVGELAARLTRLLEGDAVLLLVPGEQWADMAHDDLAGMPAKTRAVWIELIKHAFTATTSKPSSKWSNAAGSLVAKATPSALRECLTGWFSAVRRGRSIPMLGSYAGDVRGAADTFNQGNETVLRGLVWMLASAPDPDSPRLLADLLMTSIKKVPGVGPRAVKLANACVWALGECAGGEDEAVRTAALGQLARLKARVTFKTTLNAIDKALNKAAELSGVSREDLEEMAVPTYGLEEVGKRIETLGDHTAELIVTGTSSTELRWIKHASGGGGGKPQKSVPKAVKDRFADDLKELKAAAKDIQKMLPAQRDRLDLLHLQQKTWAYDTWAERYLNHPLVGVLARRLVWVFDHGEGKDKVEAAWLDGRLVDAAGDPVEVNPASATVAMWHPIGHDETQIIAWRAFFEDRQIKQPFKQAHREVYLLTDAERTTGVYSNRYAAHLIKQHQFNALCGVRSWRNKLRLMVDDEYPPATLELPAWDLRAEFWVEGAGDNYGTDTTESGTYLYLATDQVRFYPLGAAQNSAHASGGGYAWSRWRQGTEPEPIPLEQIPPLVFSEVMRDVDLFVGVASVGNDPAWEDGGRQVRYGHEGYWADFSFGDLSATATTRKQLLERLVPRLKIADRCSFTDRFLVVRGDVRTYKIHLGSGNILMKPNDQYLCIVPGRGEVKGQAGKVFLPFEGDRTLSIILSKAFLLAEDAKITDPTILSQINRA